MGNGSELGKSNGEQLSKRELTKKVNSLVWEYPRRSIMDNLYEMVRKGEGRTIIGSVPGRPEDSQLVIDAVGEHVLANIAKEISLPAFIFGEHNNYPLSEVSESPQVYIAIDSFDNTSQYRRGLDTSVYTVLGVYDLDGKPIAGVVGDIKDRKAYVNVGNASNNNWMLDLDTGELKDLHPSKRVSVKDENFTLATYLGSNEYSIDFYEKFQGLIKDMSPRGVLYPGGGSYIYGLLASGAVDAYVMFNEPHSEIIPGLPLALATGCTVVSVNEDGTFENYSFNKDLYWGDHDLYNTGKVPFFIAAATPEIRDEIIGYYITSQKQNELGTSDVSGSGLLK